METQVTRILLVDDDLPVLRAIKRQLERLGHRVLDASSGERALALAEEEDIDLLLTDILMPEMNGVVLAARMMERWPDMPVLFNTGGCPVKLREQAGLMGRVLNKGLPPEEIKEAIEDAMAGSRGPAPDAARSNTL